MKQNDLMKTQNSFTLIKAVILQRLLTALKSDFPQGRWHGSTNTGRLTARSNTRMLSDWNYHCRMRALPQYGNGNPALKCNEKWKTQVFLLNWSESVARDL